MDFPELKTFITRGIAIWEQIKKDFSDDAEMSIYLKKAYPVIVFDHRQIDMNFAKNLYEPLCDDWAKTPEEKGIIKKREDFRQEMVSYFENHLNELFLEIRFPLLEIGQIMRLKEHPLIKDINSHSKASIRVIILSQKNI